MNIELPEEQRRRFGNALRSAGKREIGGILMGEQLETGHFRVVDFSVDSITGGNAHFVRSPEAHRNALDAFFRRTGKNYTRFNYLGEWHSHPSFSVSPSQTDCESMRSLVGGERDIDFAFLMIFRLHWWIRLEYSATLFMRE